MGTQQPNRPRHNRRSLGMQRHYVPPQGGGHVDARTDDSQNPQVATEGQGVQTRPPTYQGQLPTGGRASDRQA